MVPQICILVITLMGACGTELRAEENCDVVDSDPSVSEIQMLHATSKENVSLQVRPGQPAGDQVVVVQMVRDLQNDDKKCGDVGSPDRTFDLHGANATEANCKYACLEDDDCRAFSANFGQWCIGCNVTLDFNYPDSIAYTKGEVVVQMVRDLQNDDKKCGDVGGPDRTFDLRGAEATEANCKYACLEDDDCRAFSANFGQWCVGCNVTLDFNYPDSIAYTKEEAVIQMVRDLQNDDKKCGDVGSPDRTFDLRGATATEANCKLACAADDDCRAFSANFGQWCVGCNVALDFNYPESIAYTKGEA